MITTNEREFITISLLSAPHDIEVGKLKIVKYPGQK